MTPPTLRGGVHKPDARERSFVTMALTELPDDAFTNPLLDTYWVRPAGEIDAHLDELRSQPMQFFREPEMREDAPLPQGPGAWAVTSHADIVHMSKNPKLFSSAQGIVVGDMPQEMLEFFGSMIAMDDPRHVRLRRIVAAGFTPKMMQRLEDSVQLVARDIVDDISERGEVDFVVDVAAKLPLKIVCDLMGIPGSEYQFVFDRTNIILGFGDPEYTADFEGDLLTGLITAATDLVGLMNDVAASKSGGDGTDLTSMLMNATVPEDELTPEDIASFFILLVVAGNETTRNAISWGLKLLTDNPEEHAKWAADFNGLAPSAIEEIVRLVAGDDKQYEEAGDVLWGEFVFRHGCVHEHRGQIGSVPTRLGGRDVVHESDEICGGRDESGKQVAFEVGGVLGIAETEDDVRPVEHELVLGAGDAHQIAHDLEGELGCDIDDEVDLSPLGDVVDDVSCDELNRVLKSLHHLRGEPGGDDPAQPHVSGVVHGDHGSEELEHLLGHVADNDALC